ncbi:hypothetical protein P7K49_004417 [Saguinus oedipus]|uniref:Uncharacterized protein n=1 Tax=Saguinus oedipus TaxID=9490 RepID=A0ABQ9W816_SAGOE|nr:hypothetical protein P7K49_004417 [Saguinus oedipus]
MEFVYKAPTLPVSGNGSDRGGWTFGERSPPSLPYSEENPEHVCKVSTAETVQTKSRGQPSQ